jgi:PIN domain nuclease of toxin-antitoxin system
LNLLVDSHVAVWWLDAPTRLAPAARNAIAEGRNRVYLSVASIWEIGLEAARNKLRLPPDYVDLLQADGFGVLDIRRAHAERATALPPHHADPFDRMLLAQAEIEGLTMVTRDAALRAYGVPIVEA